MGLAAAQQLSRGLDPRQGEMHDLCIDSFVGASEAFTVDACDGRLTVNCIRRRVKDDPARIGASWRFGWASTMEDHCGSTRSLGWSCSRILDDEMFGVKIF